MPLHISHARIDEIKSVSYIFCHMFVDGITYKLYYMRIKTIHPHQLNPGKHLSLVFSMLLISSLVWAQQAAKPIWILFDVSDSLCVNMAGNSFRFYRYDKKYPYWDLSVADDASIDCDTIHSLRRIRHIVTRKELFLLLDKYPGNLPGNNMPSPESKDNWYNRLYPVTYILVKKGCYYLRYWVVKVDIFD